tara:strand:+ start:86 stop:358 length:273 start_codon:yes stop_codon:yes gene_type:complete
MVKWTSGGSERPFNQSAANGRNEPKLPIFCGAANVGFVENRSKGLKKSDPFQKLAPFGAHLLFAEIVNRNLSRASVPKNNTKYTLPAHPT